MSRLFLLLALAFSIPVSLRAAAVPDVPCAKCAGQKTAHVLCAHCNGMKKLREECVDCSAKGVVMAKCPDCDGLGLRNSSPCTTCSGVGTLAETCQACQGKGGRMLTCGSCSGKGSSVRDGQPESCGNCGGTGKVEEKCSLCEEGKVKKPCRTCEGRGLTGTKCTKCSGNKVVEKVCSVCNKKGYLDKPCERCKSAGFTDRNCDACRGKGVVAPKNLRTFTFSSNSILYVQGAKAPVELGTRKEVFPTFWRVNLGTNAAGHIAEAARWSPSENACYVSCEKLIKSKPRPEDVRKNWLKFPTMQAALFYLLRK